MCEYCDRHQISFGDVLYTEKEIDEVLLNNGLFDEDKWYGIPIEYCPCCGRSLAHEFFAKNQETVEQ